MTADVNETPATASQDTRWRDAWRAAAPFLGEEGLLALRTALQADDPRLLQGGTTSPPPLSCVADSPVEACCPFALAAVPALGGWGTATVAGCEQRFAAICYEADEGMAEHAGCRHFLIWWDERPRDEVRRLLLAEVLLSLRNQVWEE